MNGLTNSLLSKAAELEYRAEQLERDADRAADLDAGLGKYIAAAQHRFAAKTIRDVAEAYSGQELGSEMRTDPLDGNTFVLRGLRHDVRKPYVAPENATHFELLKERIETEEVDQILVQISDVFGGHKNEVAVERWLTWELVHPAEPRELLDRGYYHITGHGKVIASVEPDPPVQMGETIKIGDQTGVVVAIERHSVADSPRVGMNIGILLDVNAERRA